MDHWYTYIATSIAIIIMSVAIYHESDVVKDKVHSFGENTGTNTNDILSPIKPRRIKEETILSHSRGSTTYTNTDSRCVHNPKVTVTWADPKPVFIDFEEASKSYRLFGLSKHRSTLGLTFSQSKPTFSFTYQDAPHPCPSIKEVKITIEQSPQRIFIKSNMSEEKRQSTYKHEMHHFNINKEMYLKMKMALQETFQEKLQKDLQSIQVKKNAERIFKILIDKNISEITENISNTTRKAHERFDYVSYIK